MNPKIWGPPTWFFLHSVTLGYPVKPTDIDKQNIKEFFESVGKILPCGKCKDNYKKHLSKLPLNETVLSSRDNLVKWLIDVHNEVNIATNKSILNYDQAIENFIASQNKNDNTMVMISIITIIVIILIILPYVFIQFSK